jgi:inactivated superfamily I helicase
VKVLLGYDARPVVGARLKDPEDEGLHATCVPESDIETFSRALADAEVLWHVLQPVTAQQIVKAPRRIAFLVANLRASERRVAARCRTAGGNRGNRRTRRRAGGLRRHSLVAYADTAGDGARVLYWTRVPKQGVSAQWRSLDDLLAESDIVSLHCVI